MKKVVRLTESDLVKIVKRVIKENKQTMNEGTSKVAGATFIYDASNPYVNINGRKFKTSIDSSLYKGPLVITGIQEKAGSLYGTNVCITTNANQSQCFDIDEAKKLISKVNQGNTWIEVGNALGKVIFQAWQ